MLCHDTECKRAFVRERLSIAALMCFGPGCWKCGTELPQAKVVCRDCKTVQQGVEEASYFQLFGM